jgi:hypothetical protein
MCEEEWLEDNMKLQKQDGGAWTRLSAQGQVLASCECDNEPLVPIK